MKYVEPPELHDFFSNENHLITPDVRQSLNSCNLSFYKCPDNASILMHDLNLVDAAFKLTEVNGEFRCTLIAVNEQE